VPREQPASGGTVIRFDLTIIQGIVYVDCKSAVDWFDSPGRCLKVFALLNGDWRKMFKDFAFAEPRRKPERFIAAISV
jgi:hypothetical protein